ncbi:MAG: SDR family oxidoreductase [Armatimonadetes bacterium]|nr:SDR family oxidoreductase [Armatimonadota bacterium]
METGLNGKAAIVTGAAMGVGRAIAYALADEGVRVTIADIDEGEGRKAADKINSGGGEAIFVRTDVTQSGQVKSMVEQALSRFGRIDILVNNAGIVGQQGPWHLLDEENFDQVVAINFKGTYLCSKAVVPHMIEQRGGKIINISSCAGKTGEENNGVYSATKAAVWNMVHSLSGELGQYGINVNAVCPAAMDTALMEKVYRERAEHFGLNPDELRKKIADGFRLPRTLTVEDAAGVVVFLASDMADMMTGQGVNITGGIELH